MLSTLLKNHTKHPHQLLEKNLVERIKNISNQQGYIDLLSVFYSFIAPLEKKIETYPVGELLPDYPERRKSLAIANDLTALGANTSNIRLCANLPAIDNTFQAIGALYVLEGSTLGGQVILKMIKDRIPGISDRALSFFDSYGADIMPMWERFKAALDRIGPEHQQEVAHSAAATFSTFKNWTDTYD